MYPSIFALLGALFLLTGCVSYRSTSAEQAIREERKVRVITVDGQKFKGVVLRREGTKIQGFRRAGGVFEKQEKKVFELSPDQFQSVEMVDGEDTFIRSTLFPIVIVAGVGLPLLVLLLF